MEPLPKPHLLPTEPSHRPSISLVLLGKTKTQQTGKKTMLSKLEAQSACD